MLKTVTKKWEKIINFSFYSPKTIFANNFGQLCMVVYTAKIKIFKIINLYMMV